MGKSLELQKNNDQIAGSKELNEIFENVLPWSIESKSSKELLAQNTIQNKEEIERFLDSLYLFKVNEISISDTEKDIASLIYKKQQALITTAYQSSFTLTTIILGNGGGTIDLYLGVAGNSKTKNVFKDQAHGVFQGKGIEFLEEKQDYRILKERLINKKHGGIIAGIPTQKLDDEKQTFDLTSVIRSMNGQEFVLLMASRPVPKNIAAQQIHELMSLKDRCHSLANRTLGSELSDSINHSDTHLEGRSNSNTTGTTNTRGSSNTGGFVFILNATHSSSKSKSDTESTTYAKSISDSETIGWSKSIGENLSYEQQNSLAMELELIADKLIKRIRAGLNTGIWENFITYATLNETASRILSGTLAGELMKADSEALPIRNISSEFTLDIPIFLPKKKGNSILSGNKLVSFMSSDEASLIMAPPINSVPGFDVRIKPSLSLTDVSGSRKNGVIAKISEHGRAIEGSTFSISKNDIRKHIFVTGLTGSGKTTTVKQILLSADNTPFLVLESAKREYRRLLPEKEFSNLEVYTLGDSDVSPIRHNPFMVLPKVSLITHIDNLKSIFNASFSLYGPMPYILEKCLFNIYQQKGWDITSGKHHQANIENFEDCETNSFIYPTIVDLKNEVNRYVKFELEYKGELQDNIRSAIVTRLESLAVGSKGFIFNTSCFINFKDLLKKQVVFELESLADDDDKAFFVGLILALVSEYRQSLARESVLNHIDDLKHIMVVEEAHRLLKNVNTERSSEMMGNPKGKAVEAFCNIIAEMRSLGQGVIVAEQIPTKIAPDVIKNTNTKIAHRLVSFDDQVAMGAGLGLNDDESRYLNQLTTGFALAHKEGMSKPVEINVFNTLQNTLIGDIKIRELGNVLFNGNLEEALNLHESGLLWNKNLKAISVRLMNSIFLSKMELKEILPFAVKEIRVTSNLNFVKNATIELAIKRWFKTILLSPLYNLGNGNKIDEPLIEAIDRFWTEDFKYSRSRLVSTFDKWSGEDCCEKIKLVTINNLIINKLDNQEKLSLALNKALLVENEVVRNEIFEAYKKRIM